MVKQSKRIQEIAEIYKSNTKYNFRPVVTANTIQIKGNAEIVARIFAYLLNPSQDFWIILKQVGTRSMIYDADKLLDKKWANIWKS